MKQLGSQPRAFWRRLKLCSLGSHCPGRDGRCVRCGRIVAPYKEVAK